MGLIHFVILSILLASVAPHEGVNLQVSCSSKSSGNIHNLSTNPIRLTLHHPRDPCSPSPLPPLPFSTVLEHDNRRVHALSRRITRHKYFKDSTVSTPLSPGTSLGVSNYITRIGLGTPSKPYTMVVDTGSGLSWLQCFPCIVYCHQQVGPIFDPKISTSYATIPCSAPECDSLKSETGNPPGCTVSNVCAYAASYGDGSVSKGYLSRDILSIGSLSVPTFVFGCGQENIGLFGGTAGLLGLSKYKLSLFSQLSAKVGTTAFSYCLPTSSSTGYVSFGPYAASKFSYTPMVAHPREANVYFLQLSRITVGGMSITVTPSAYSSLPTVIDSGTVITRLPSEVYSALSNSLSVALSSKYTKAKPYSILDTCFVGSAKTIAVPEVSLVFQGGATMNLSANNVLIDVTTSDTCLAFAKADIVALIGNHQQQTFDVVYDVDKARIGFAPGGCR